MTAPSRPSRREFIEESAALVAGVVACPYVLADKSVETRGPRSPNERFGIGAIGMRYQGTVIAEQTLPFGDVVAICDVDREHAETARRKLGDKADLYEDYRKILDRRDIHAVTIGTPDHWHTAMAIAACRAGKDVYCEKPLTLTVDEGKLLRKVVEETGRVLQVGSWQRSDWRFRLACELVRGGHIGKLEWVEVTLGRNKQGGPFKNTAPPPHFNWELWQGQTPWVPYCKERTHYTFRWWYEYSGGQMTDWGAHHMDIAQWGMGEDRGGPVEIDGTADFPDVRNGFNVAKSFQARLAYSSGALLRVTDTGSAKVIFRGERGTIGVARGKIWGTPFDGGPAEATAAPLARDAYKLYARDNLDRPLRTGKREATMNHMGNFFDCIRTRHAPISDVESQHRSATVCHLANISMRLGRKLRWDPVRETFPGDGEASAWLSREQRKGYEIS